MGKILSERWRFFPKPNGKLKRSASADVYQIGTGQYLCGGKLNGKHQNKNVVNDCTFIDGNKKIYYPDTCIYKMRMHGSTVKELADEYGISRERIRQIFRTANHQLKRSHKFNLQLLLIKLDYRYHLEVPFHKTLHIQRI